MKKYSLVLFVTGNSPRSERAVGNLVRMCDEALSDDYELTIIDVLEQPDLAEEANILATPTLIKMMPNPVHRLFGDFSEPKKVMMELGLGG